MNTPNGMISVITTMAAPETTMQAMYSISIARW
jgi:hypothetical protein